VATKSIDHAQIASAMTYAPALGRPTPAPPVASSRCFARVEVGLVHLGEHDYSYLRTFSHAQNLKRVRTPTRLPNHLTTIHFQEQIVSARAATVVTNSIGSIGFAKWI
jgi:hypothetical protein